jgi:hypothetical protein
MNMQVRHNKTPARRKRDLAVTVVVLEPPVREPLDEMPEKILAAFWDLKKETGRYPRTAHIAEKAGCGNETWVRGHLMDLVSSGYIAAYRKKCWRWCDCEKAQSMILARPEIQVRYEDLGDREDGQKN